MFISFVGGFLTREFGNKFDDETITQENLDVLTDNYSR